jgi:hypothetical protein
MMAIPSCALNQISTFKIKSPKMRCNDNSSTIQKSAQLLSSMLQNMNTRINVYKHRLIVLTKYNIVLEVFNFTVVMALLNLYFLWEKHKLERRPILYFVTQDMLTFCHNPHIILFILLSSDWSVIGVNLIKMFHRVCN